MSGNKVVYAPNNGNVSDLKNAEPKPTALTKNGILQMVQAPLQKF